MSSHPRSESPGSSSRPRATPDPVPLDPHALDDLLANPGPPTDDTPTIISRFPPTPPPATAAEPSGIRGRRLAHFELIEPIGVGGMAAVLRARDTQLDRFVALKILPPEMAGDEENVKRFHQEARSAAKLDHENIARVFFCGEDQRLHFIAFEFVEGDNLRVLLERRGKLPLGEAVHYLLQVAAGLAHAARRGVVHRDIKPSNIIVTPNGRAKLVDMGLARSLEPRGDNDLTQPGVTMGTFDYISPEQALEPRDADVRSDIYSLGCTFYHLLTGKPPVPEGTPAKKMHHHQHVKPLDPRLAVPDLPVEAVLILDRMMAKNPRDRFQTPEHLVQQLLLLSRKLGTTPEIPEGVLSVEAVVPSPPTTRPLFWAAVAAVAVVALVLVLDQIPTGSQGPNAAREPRVTSPEGGNHEKAGGAVVKGADAGEGARTTEAKPTEATYEAGDEPSARELLDWLEKHKDVKHLTLLLTGPLELSPPQAAAVKGLVVKADKVTIRPRDTGGPVTIRLRYDAGESTNLVALTIDAAESLVSDVRFVIDATGADVKLTALQLKGGTKHEVQRCAFLQARPSFHPNSAVVSLHALAGGSRTGKVTVTDSVFAGFGMSEDGDEKRLSASGGHLAIVRDGPVSVKAKSCAFGPHVAILQIQGGRAAEQGLVAVEDCSFLLGAARSAAFDLAAGVSGGLDVSGSLFARLGTADRTEDGAVFLRQADGDAKQVTFKGKENGFYDLDAYWVERGDWKKATWADLRRRSEPGEDSSRVVVYYPWEADAVGQVRALDQEAWGQAFRLNEDLAAVRRPGNMRTALLGAKAVLTDSLVPAKLPPVEEKTPGPGRRLLAVEKGGEDVANGIYGSLEDAVAAARPEDTIVVRHTGVMKVEPMAVRKGLRSLTIRPARRHKPILELGTTTETEAALFRVSDGQLRLEELEVRLSPEKNDVKSLAVVALSGEGDCLLKDCAVTLSKPLDAQLAVAVVQEQARPRSETGRVREQGARLTVEGCFVRGEGDLLASRVNRPLALEVKDSVLMLAGSVANLSPELVADGEPPADGQKVRVGLQSTTAYLGGNLIRVSVTRDSLGMLPVAGKAVQCLFVPAVKAMPLVHLESSDSEDKGLREKFTWEGSKGNAYAGFTSLVNQEAGGMGMMMGVEKWKMQEESSAFSQKMEQVPPAVTPFARMEADQLKAIELPAAVGAPAGKPPRPM